MLVVGSGFGAAAPAMRLAEAGFGVMVVEKGPDLDPARDFRQTQDPPYLLRYLKGLSGDHLGFGYVEALGGGSGFYEMISLRALSAAFRQVDASGHPLWPAGLDRARPHPAPRPHPVGAGAAHRLAAADPRAGGVSPPRRRPLTVAPAPERLPTDRGGVHQVPEATRLPELSFSTTHQVGSARMADDPSRGVVDRHGEAFRCPGLYVADGAAIPSSLAVSSSLTILANAERIAAGIADRYRA